jgi:hypothetical protein
MTPLFKKLNYKNQGNIVVLNAPESFKSELDALTHVTDVNIITDVSLAESVEFTICFVRTQAEIDTFISSIDHKLNGDATIWLCYPKASSKKYTCEFNRDTGFGILGKYRLEGVRQVAIDDDWSALRFRKVEYIKKITRRESFALTKEAKQRTTKKGE